MKRMLVISIVVMFTAGVLFPTVTFAKSSTKAATNSYMEVQAKQISGSLSFAERILRWLGVDIPLFSQTDPNAPADPTDKLGWAVDEKTGALLDPINPNALQKLQSPYYDDREPPRLFSPTDPNALSGKSGSPYYDDREPPTTRR